MTKIRTRDEGRNHIRELLVGDEVASWLTVIDYQIRIGTARVSMAGIGGVETKHEHRRKGYMRTLFEDTVTYMLTQGYDVSMLFGIANFYPKFGYATCLPKYKLSVTTREAERAVDSTTAKVNMSQYTMRLIEEADMPKVVKLYNRHNADKTCSLVRNPTEFKAFRKGTWWGVKVEAWLWENANGQIVAYAVWDKSDEAVNVVEVESYADTLFPTLLYTFAVQAIEKRCENINLYMPFDHPFAEFVQRYGCKWTIQNPKNSDGMMRVLNQDTLFEKLQPELEHRLQVARLGAYTGTLIIQTDLGTTTLDIDKGTVTASTGSKTDRPATLTLSQDQLIQLVVGYRSARDIVNDPAVKVARDSVPLLDALFPKTHPYVWLADHF